MICVDETVCCCVCAHVCEHVCRCSRTDAPASWCTGILLSAVCGLPLEPIAWRDMSLVCVVALRTRGPLFQSVEQQGVGAWPGPGQNLPGVSWEGSCPRKVPCQKHCLCLGWASSAPGPRPSLSLRGRQRRRYSALLLRLLGSLPPIQEASGQGLQSCGCQQQPLGGALEP